MLAPVQVCTEEHFPRFKTRDICCFGDLPALIDISISVVVSVLETRGAVNEGYACSGLRAVQGLAQDATNRRLLGEANACGGKIRNEGTPICTAKLG